jgi:hypothetical protein
MTLPIKAIPTEFNGVRYRSQLEARWAAFFQMVGWDVHYEPFALDGYIPDFVKHGCYCNEPLIIEVKPVMGENDPLLQETMNKLDRVVPHKFECLIVSYFLPNDGQSIGWLRQGNQLFDWEGGGDGHGCWALAPFSMDISKVGVRSLATTLDVSASTIASAQARNVILIKRSKWTAGLGFCHDEQSFEDRITGYYNGSCGGDIDDSHYEKIKELFARAGSLVQWKRD